MAGAEVVVCVCVGIRHDSGAEAETMYPCCISLNFGCEMCRNRSNCFVFCLCRSYSCLVLLLHSVNPFSLHDVVFCPVARSSDQCVVVPLRRLPS